MKEKVFLFEADLDKLESLKFDILKRKGMPTETEHNMAIKQHNRAFYSIILTPAFIVGYIALHLESHSGASTVVLAFTYFALFYGMKHFWFYLSHRLKRPIWIQAIRYYYEKCGGFNRNRSDYISIIEGDYGFLWKLHALYQELSANNLQYEKLFKASKKGYIFNEHYEDYVQLLEELHKFYIGTRTTLSDKILIRKNYGAQLIGVE